MIDTCHLMWRTLLIYPVTIDNLSFNLENIIILPFYIITKLPECGDLCGNITEFGMAEEFYFDTHGPPPPQTK